jgi:hypothetical protein
VAKARQAAKRTPKALGPRVRTGKAIPAATPTPVSAEVMRFMVWSVGFGMGLRLRLAV